MSGPIKTKESPPSDTTVWPDNAPSVAMDVGLGKKYSYIGFDPYKYGVLLDELGVPLEKSSELDITLKDGSLRPEIIQGEDIIGMYTTSRGYSHPKIDLRVLDYDILRRLYGNRSLIHESQHWADDLSGELAKSKAADRKKTWGVKSIIKGAGMIVLGATTVFVPIEVFAGGVDSLVKAAAAMGGGYVGLLPHIALTHRRVYRESSHERQARETGVEKKKDFGQIMTFVERPTRKTR